MDGEGRGGSKIAGIGKPTAEGGGATRPSENHAIWDHLGMTEGKCFGILVD